MDQIKAQVQRGEQWFKLRGMDSDGPSYIESPSGSRLWVNDDQKFREVMNFVEELNSYKPIWKRNYMKNIGRFLTQKL